MLKQNLNDLAHYNELIFNQCSTSISHTNKYTYFNVSFTSGSILASMHYAKHIMKVKPQCIIFIH